MQKRSMASTAIISHLVKARSTNRNPSAVQPVSPKGQSLAMVEVTMGTWKKAIVSRSTATRLSVFIRERSLRALYLATTNSTRRLAGRLASTIADTRLAWKTMAQSGAVSLRSKSVELEEGEEAFASPLPPPPSS